MKKTFVLKKGEITFDEDKILINDYSKKDNIKTIIFSAIWIFYGITLIVKYTKTQDSFMLWSGIALIAGHLWLLIRTIRRSTDEVIKLEDVQSIKIENQLTNDFIVIKHNEGKYRVIGNIDFPKEIESFISEYNMKNSL